MVVIFTKSCKRIEKKPPKNTGILFTGARQKVSRPVDRERKWRCEGTKGTKGEGQSWCKLDEASAGRSDKIGEGKRGWIGHALPVSDRFHVTRFLSRVMISSPTFYEQRQQELFQGRGCACLAAARSRVGEGETGQTKAHARGMTLLPAFSFVCFQKCWELTWQNIVLGRVVFKCSQAI